MRFLNATTPIMLRLIFATINFEYIEKLLLINQYAGFTLRIGYRLFSNLTPFYQKNKFVAKLEKGWEIDIVRKLLC